MDSDNNNKTLIGSENYLFLVNDSAKELEVHCNNLMLVDKKNLSRYNNNLEKFLLIVLTFLNSGFFVNETVLITSVGIYLLYKYR